LHKRCIDDDEMSELPGSSYLLVSQNIKAACTPPSVNDEMLGPESSIIGPQDIRQLAHAGGLRLAPHLPELSYQYGGTQDRRKDDSPAASM
jgi:hypothetical protein